VTIVMSHGPIMVVVPDVSNLTFSQASDRLAAKGLSFSVNGPVRGGDVVIGQTPSARSKVPLEGTTVVLTFGPQS
jgi:beta-lactam-binding protein with PASTA domain